MSILSKLKGAGAAIMILRRISNQNKDIIKRQIRMDKKLDKLLKKEKR